MYIPRLIEPKIRDWLFREKIIVIYGARQTGKSTIVNRILANYPKNSRYFNGDETETRRLFSEAGDRVTLKRIAGDAKIIVIDEAQKKIDGLTTNVVSLQELLGDKRSRGAFGEVQLEALVRNILPPSSYALQHTLSNGTRADCVLFLPEPTGNVAVDSKFPMENYHRMFAPGVAEKDRVQAQRQFKADIKKHIDDIADKYIIADETSDGAVMFVPAEAVFAEIHGYNAAVVDYAMQKRVWIVSPTTLMAILNTARAVLKDVETRKQVHIIKESLSKLGKEFERFYGRMKKLADHIRLAHQDAEEVHITSQKISRRFALIEGVQLEGAEPPVVDVLDVSVVAPTSV